MILSCLDGSEFRITGAFQQRPIKHRGRGRKLQGTFRQQETSDSPTGTRLAPPEGPQLPSGRRSRRPSGMCLPVSPGTRCPWLFPGDTPAPGDTVPAVPAAPASLQCSLELLCSLSPAAWEQRGPRSLGGLPCGVDTDQGREAGPPCRGQRLRARGRCSGCSLLQDSLVGLPSSKTTSQSSEPLLNVSLLTWVLPAPTVPILFTSNGLLWSPVRPLLPLYYPAL